MQPHLKVLAALTQANFYSWLHTTMKDDRQGNLGVLAMQGFRLSLNVDNWNTQWVCD